MRIRIEIHFHANLGPTIPHEGNFRLETGIVDNRQIQVEHELRRPIAGIFRFVIEIPIQTESATRFPSNRSASTAES